MNGKIKLGPFGNLKIAPTGKYLGVMMNPDGYMDDEVQHRISQAQKAMQCLNNIWKSRELPVEVKIGIFNTMVRTVLTYALDAHVLTHTQLQRLESAQTVMIRRATRTPAHIDKEKTPSYGHVQTYTHSHQHLLTDEY